MSYADSLYYKTTYLGYDPGNDADIIKALMRAAEDIDMRCGELTESDFDPASWEYVKKANCAQAEFYLLNGEAYNDGGGVSGTLGKFSYGGGTGSLKAYSDRFRNLLAMSGACNGSVSVSGRECCCD